MSRELQHVDIYTDGSCLQAYSYGGYAFILSFEDKSGKRYMTIVSGAFRGTTNNRMEMTAIIFALQRLNHRCNVSVHTDSRLVVDMYNTGMIYKWRAGCYRRNGRKLKNLDLWRNLVKETDKHEVDFDWIKGHSGNEFNELCDEFAGSAARRLMRNDEYRTCEL